MSVPPSGWFGVDRRRVRADDEIFGFAARGLRAWPWAGAAAARSFAREYPLVADTLIDKVIALEKRAEEMVAEARAQAKRLEEEAARQLKEMQARHHADLERERQELRTRAETRLKEALAAEDRRFAELSAEIRSKAEPQVESAAAEVVRDFFAGGEGQEAGHGH